MSFLQLWGLRLLIVLMACGITWGAADVHYSKQITALKVAHTQELKDQQAEDAATLSRYAQSALEINDEAANTIAGMSGDIHDLGVRGDDARQALALCTAPVPLQPVPNADGSGTAASGAAAPGAGGSTEQAEPSIAIEAGQLRSDLEVARKAIESELLFRQWLRENGQAPAETVTSH